MEQAQRRCKDSLNQSSESIRVTRTRSKSLTLESNTESSQLKDRKVKTCQPSRRSNRNRPLLGSKTDKLTTLNAKESPQIKGSLHSRTSPETSKQTIQNTQPLTETQYENTNSHEGKRCAKRKSQSPASQRKRLKSPMTDSSEDCSEPRALLRKRSIASIDQSPLVNSTNKRRSTEKRKSRRRSSFISGRIIKDLPKCDGTDLCGNIQINLPAGERLEKLVMSTLEYTLEKLQDENPSLDGLQQLTVHVRESVTEQVQSLKETNTFENATNILGNKNSPMNVALQQTIEQGVQYKEKLDTECKKWDGLLELRTKLADEAEKLSKNEKKNLCAFEVRDLKPELKELLDKRLDHKKMLDNLEEMEERLTVGIDETTKGVRVLEKIKAAEESKLQQKAKKLKKRAFKNIEEFADPRNLIQQAF